MGASRRQRFIEINCRHNPFLLFSLFRRQTHVCQCISLFLFQFFLLFSFLSQFFPLRLGRVMMSACFFHPLQWSNEATAECCTMSMSLIAYRVRMKPNEVVRKDEWTRRVHRMWKLNHMPDSSVQPLNESHIWASICRHRSFLYIVFLLSHCWFMRLFLQRQQFHFFYFVKGTRSRNFTLWRAENFIHKYHSMMCLMMWVLTLRSHTKLLIPISICYWWYDRARFNYEWTN